VYVVGSEQAGKWSAEAEFKTAPADGNAPFAFVYFGDTHCRAEWGRTLDLVAEEYPETAFYLLAGDLVGTGLDRNDWDEFFHLSSSVFARRPVAPCIGNHDDQDGLGPGMYLDAFALPHNGPAGIEAERVYSFEYGDALFLMLDIGSPEDVQAAWLKEQLADSGATWKFAMFHFPPYAPDEDYETLRTLWGSVFDEYGVDLVMSGHVHYYLRTHPMRGGERAEAYERGTVYVTSVAVPYKADVEVPDYAAAVKLAGPPLYQVIRIEGNRLVYEARDAAGEKVDELVLEKP
jgi:3',5'-cyclic AMP phosphodiesterase CpdA